MFPLQRIADAVPHGAASVEPLEFYNAVVDCDMGGTRNKLLHPGWIFVPVCSTREALLCLIRTKRFSTLRARRIVSFMAQLDVHDDAFDGTLAFRNAHAGDFTVTLDGRHHAAFVNPNVRSE